MSKTKKNQTKPTFTQFSQAAGVALAMVVAATSFHAPSALAAQGASEAKTRINLAGRQRMLSQKMAKAACFAGLDENRFEHLTELQQAHETFDITLAGLMHGNDNQGLAAEANAEVQSALAQVATLWTRLDTSVRNALTAGRVDRTALATIADTNVPVLVQMNEAVGLMARSYATDGDLDEARARTINVAGRQRMLSQKMAKELCQIRSGLASIDATAALGSTIAQFESALTDLMTGNNGLETPQSAIAGRLERVETAFHSVRETYQKALDGQDVSTAETLRAAQMSNRILREMNHIVFAYDVLD